MFVESQWHSIDIDDNEDYTVSEVLTITQASLYITFQTNQLLQHFRTNRIKKLPTIIDLECLDKQMAQEGKEFRSYKNWKAIHALRHHKIIDSEFNLNKSNFKTVLEHLSLMFKTLIEKDDCERKRFENIELNINQIIYERQYKGISIDFEIAKEKCVEIEGEIYRLKNILQLDYGIFTPENEAQQLSYLDSKKFNYIKSLTYSFKIRRNQDPICLLFYELLRNQNDLDSFIFMLSHWGGNNKTYPTFLGFGTISSRITLRQPALQNLKKNNRVVIVPDKGMKFLYIDYGQFEAGILASMSDDDMLINLYNSDIYTDLAEKVLGDRNQRSDAKIIFYRFMYGDTTLDAKSQLYFSKFKKLAEFKKSIENNISKNKKIGSYEGNYRYSFDNESPWSLSHVIQSTASLIYKKALIRVRNEVRNVEFLIPMHDATLYQIDEFNYIDYSKRIENIYIEEFKKVCPKIDPIMHSSELFN
jgi:DNA polymerase I-like protein with 3'-5' exonuclease and polymerase domains